MNASLVQIAAVVAAVGFVGLIGFQLLLALGFPLGRAAWGGRYEKLPTGLRIASLLSTGVFVIASLLVLERAQVIKVFDNPAVVTYGVWTLVVLLGLNTLANFVSASKWEKQIMAPVALVLCLLCLVVAVMA